ncbi:MAG TPA: hypothetical protein VLR92_11270 [Blastocatellia bacterium]|nr:hypothetical protein [Blastocatellia bacterium]
MDALQQQAPTVAIKACIACASALLERDNFCRRCGAPQPGSESLALNRVVKMPTEAAECCAPFWENPNISNRPRGDAYRRISGPFVNAVVTGALSTPSTKNQNPFVQRVILVLISIPIWLIIVLLSPLDAYAAVKYLARQA